MSSSDSRYNEVKRIIFRITPGEAERALFSTGPPSLISFMPPANVVNIFQTIECTYEIGSDPFDPDHDSPRMMENQQRRGNIHIEPLL